MYPIREAWNIGESVSDAKVHDSSALLAMQLLLVTTARLWVRSVGMNRQKVTRPIHHHQGLMRSSSQRLRHVLSVQWESLALTQWESLALTQWESLALLQPKTLFQWEHCNLSDPRMVQHRLRGPKEAQH